MPISSNRNKWFICPRTAPEAQTRLFLFPYAGAGPAVFYRWASEMPGIIEVWSAHYPGRGSRYREAPLTQISEFAEQLSHAIQPILDRPCAFFGHSLGGLVAFELIRRLRQQNLPQPRVLFISGCGAPHLPHLNASICAQSDPDFMKSLQQLNGVPSELLNQPEAMQLLLPILRAVFEVIDRYRYSPEESLHIPIVALAGLSDPRVSREHLEGWALHTEAGFQLHEFPGDHFFINTCRESVISCISEELTTYAKK